MPVTILSGVSFSPGTVLWSAPPVSGFSPSQIAQAVPTDAGPDLYSVEKSSDGKQSLVQALTADGQQLWQVTLPPLTNNGIADAFGGFIGIGTCDSVNPMSLTDLNVVSGKWQQSFPITQNGSNICLQGVPKLAVRQDGPIVVVMPLQISPAVLVLDGLSGSVLPSLTPQIPPSTATDVFGNVSSCDCLTRVGQPIVDSDGSIYLEYEVREIPYPPTNVSSTLWLLKIAQDGSTSATQLSNSNKANLFPGAILPDGQGGVLATWGVGNLNPPAAPAPYQAAYVSAGTVITYALPMAPTQLVIGPDGRPTDYPLVLGENGTAFASYGANVVSFSLNSGAVNWNYPAAPQTGLSIIASADGNGLIARDTDQNNVDTVLRFGATGTPTADTWTATRVLYTGLGSWLGLPSLTGSWNAYYAAPLPWSKAVWPAPGGNSGGQNAAKPKINISVFRVTQAGVSNSYIQDKVNTGIAYWQLNAGLLMDWDGVITEAPGCASDNPSCSLGGPSDITDIALSTFSEVARRFPGPAKGIKVLFVNLFLFGEVGSVHGYTPTNITNPDGLHNVVILRDTSDQPLVPAHEFGHVFMGPGHVFSIFNLMCGHDSFLSGIFDIFYPCVSASANQIEKSQIRTALSNAQKLAE